MKRDVFTMPLAKRTRSIWRTMRARCSNPKHISYPSYGARGVVVCERWSDFAAFVADMGYAPPGLTIERREQRWSVLPAELHLGHSEAAGAQSLEQRAHRVSRLSTPHR